MNTIDAIKTRRSVRAWTEQNVSDDVVAQILEAGRWSPSPLNSQPWHFTVIRQKETLSALTKEAKEAPYLANANVLIVVTANKHNVPSDPSHLELATWLEAHAQYIYAAVCALHNMALAAWELGLGGVWVTIDDASSRKFLNIPEDQVIIGSLALGYSRGAPIPHREIDRKPLSEIVFYEKYGAEET